MALVRPELTVGLRSVSVSKAPVNGPSVADGGQWPLPAWRTHTFDPEQTVAGFWALPALQRERPYALLESVDV